MIIRTRLADLKAEEDKSEQQANIIQSGQVDSWIEEHKAELNNLMHELEEKREQVKVYSKLLLELEKQKIERIILNKDGALLREFKRLHLMVDQKRDTYEKLLIYNRNLRESLATEQLAYEQMVNSNPQVVDIMGEDLHHNEELYWKLLDRKEKIQRQIKQVQETNVL